MTTTATHAGAQISRKRLHSYIFVTYGCLSYELGGAFNLVQGYTNLYYTNRP